MNSKLVRWQIKRICNIHRQGPKKNIFLFSTARSGSSWLMEMLVSQPGMKFVNEPLLMSQFTHSRRSPLPPDWELLLPNPQRLQLLSKYFNDLIANKVGVGSPSPLSKYHRWRTTRIVFKILRCKDLMNWFKENFNAEIVFLIRHPIATSISRTEILRLPMFLANDTFCNQFLTKQQRKFCLRVAEEGSFLEQKVLDWALQNLPPLNYLDRSKWTCICYEDLIVRPTTVIETMAQNLELPDIDRLIAQIGVPSGSVSLSDKDTQEYLNLTEDSNTREYLLSKWRKSIDVNTEKRLMHILNELHIDLYQLGQDVPAYSL